MKQLQLEAVPLSVALMERQLVTVGSVANPQSALIRLLRLSSSHTRAVRVLQNAVAVRHREGTGRLVV